MVCHVWLVSGLVVLPSSPPLYGKVYTPDSKENKQGDAGSRLFSKAFSVRRVVVGRVLLTVCCGADLVGSTERDTTRKHF